MKKAISSLCVLAIAIIASLGGMAIAYADTFEEESDLVFRKALEEILQEECVTSPTIEVTKEPLYDLSLNQLGFMYVMQYDDKEGFALIINTDGIFGVAEFYMETANPYQGYEGQYVYVKLLLYLVWQDDCFIATESGAVLDSDIIAALSEKAFSAAGGITTGSEVINYTNKTANTFELAKIHPAYVPVGANVTNACVPAAGANVIGFWTRYYPGLMPGFTPGSVQLGFYLYKETASEGCDLVETLFYAMGTNITAPGTTIAEFKTGMNSYVSGKSRSISYSSTMVSGSFNYALTKQKLESGLPLVLFVEGLRVDELKNGTNQVTVTYSMSDACHAMSGFGYNEVTYTLANGTTRTDTYIQVATGLSNQKKGYYNIYYNTQIDECYAITIS